MDAPSVQHRLSQVTTAWTLLARAHGGQADAELAAQTALVERYHAAVYRYLLACLRDLDQADELFQEFALRLVRGDFGRADPQRGRFRDYVKTALIHLVINHQKKKKPSPLGDAAPEVPAAAQPMPSEEEFLATWRKSLLDRAWESLAAAQDPTATPYHTILHLRTEQPHLTGAELLAVVNERLLGQPAFTDAGLRKALQRAREKFTDLLVDEVARSLQSTCVEEIEQELIDLGFHAYCKRALARRRQDGEGSAS